MPQHTRIIALRLVPTQLTNGSIDSLARARSQAGINRSAPSISRIHSAVSTLSSAHPGSVAGLLFRKTMRRVLGKGRFEASARL